MRQLQPPPSVIQLSMKNQTEMSGACMAGENISCIRCWNPPAPVSCHTAPASLRTAQVPARWKWCCWRPEQQTKLSCKLLVTQLIANASTQISAIPLVVNSAFTSFVHRQNQWLLFMCGLIHSQTSASTEGAGVLSLPFPVCSLTAWSAPAPAAAPVPPLQTAASPLPEPGSGVPVPRPKKETGGYSASTLKSQELVPC